MTDGDRSARRTALLERLGRRKPGERVFRFSDSFTRSATRRLIGIMVGGLVVGLALGIASDEVPYDMRETLVTAATIVSIAAIAVPLLAGALFGGFALHPHGWIPGLLFPLGLILVGAPAFGWPGVPEWAPIAGALSIVLGVLLFFVLGFIRGVPIWIGGEIRLSRFERFRMDRRELSSGVLPGESAPGVLADPEERTDAGA